MKEYDDYREYWDSSIEDLKGRQLVKIERGSLGSGSIAEDGGDVLWFHCDTGHVFKMFHEQDCCEHVYIESIVGDLPDLLKGPILRAEASSSDEMAPPLSEYDPSNPDTYKPESYTWTFYKLATIGGYVDIRWYGESNGYYSERASFVCTVNPDDPQKPDTEQ
jgi:hypothetical protein